MKHNVKKQLIELLEGLGLDAWEAMEKPPKYFREVGQDFQRLATAGYRYVESMQEKLEQQQEEADDTISTSDEKS